MDDNTLQQGIRWTLDCFLAQSARLLSHFGGKVPAVHGQSVWQCRSLENLSTYLICVWPG